MPDWLIPWATPISILTTTGVWLGIRAGVPAFVDWRDRPRRARTARARRPRAWWLPPRRHRLTPLEEQTLYVQQRLAQKQQWRREASDRWLAEWAELDPRPAITAPPAKPAAAKPKGAFVTFYPGVQDTLAELTLKIQASEAELRAVQADRAQATVHLARAGARSKREEAELRLIRDRIEGA